MQSKATTVEKYLAELPPDRRAAIAAVRAVILQNLPSGYEEGMLYGMIGYYVPHSLYPEGYHCDPTQPLGFACLASQKNYMSLYMMSVYGDSEHARQFQSDWAKSGKKLDMGKSCIRFKKLDDLPLDVIGRAIGRVKAKNYIAVCQAMLEQMRKPRRSAKSKSKSAAKRTGKASGTRAKRKTNPTRKRGLH